MHGAERRTGLVSADLRQDAPLGIRFTASKDTERAVIASITSGTQAEQHPQLVAGLVLERVRLLFG